jgi:hypothetical protein
MEILTNRTIILKFEDNEVDTILDLLDKFNKVIQKDITKIGFNKTYTKEEIELFKNIYDEINKETT